MPSQADEYALFRSDAERIEVNVSSTVDVRCNRGFNTLMRRQLRKARQTGLSVVETDDVDGFSAMLCGCLRERHMARCLFIQHPNSGFCALVSLTGYASLQLNLTARCRPECVCMIPASWPMPPIHSLDS